VASFGGWTLTTIKAQAVEAYGSGWQANSLKVTAVEAAIMSSWCELAAEWDITAKKPSSSVPMAFQQLWFLLSMWAIADVLGCGGGATARNYGARFMRLYAIGKDPRAAANSYSYDDA
jgi:hypothetical protein